MLGSRKKLEATLREILDCPKGVPHARSGSPTRRVHPRKMAGQHFSQKDMIPYSENAVLGKLGITMIVIL
jgi:hypothetical protein